MIGITITICHFCIKIEAKTPPKQQNAVRDMRKVARNFVCPPKNAIFAQQKCEKGGYSYPYCPYCKWLASFDLAKSGKFTSGVKTSLVKLVLYLLRRARTAYYICDTGYSRTLRGRCREVGRVLFLLRPRIY